MQITCPNCRVPLELPPGLLTTGVVHVSCHVCAFSFVARLGSPSSSERTDRDPALPIYIEGVKSSSSQSETAGEIGSNTPAFIPADTKTTIVIAPDLKKDIAIHRARRGPFDHDARRVWLSASTEESTIEPDTRGLHGLRTEPIGHERTDIFELPPAKTEISTLPPLLAESSDETVRAEITTFECYAAIDSPVRPTPLSTLAHRPVPPAIAATTSTRDKPSHLSIERPFPPSIPAPATLRLPILDDHEPTLAHDFRGFPATPSHNKPIRVLSMLVTLVVFGCIAFGLFVLYQNHWTFELSNLDKMLSRAFGEAAETLPPELDKLELSAPIADLTRLAGGEPIVTAEGVIKNVGTLPRRFVYVRARIKRGSHIIASAEAPAGNLFTRAQLSKFTRKQLRAALNPAGQQGGNVRIEPGESVAYMVVIWDLPSSFDLSEHTVLAEVSQAEIDEGT